MMQLRRTEFVGEKLSTDVQNQIGSTKCISRLTKTIIYNIYYERQLLPEELFCTRIIEGIPVKEFIPETGNDRVGKLNAWIEGLMQSIEKKELKSVCLELMTLDTNRLIECYNIKYSYRDENTAKKIPEQYTTTGIQTMLKSMKNIFKNKLSPLVDKRNLMFRLTADTSGSGKDSCVFSQGRVRQMTFTPDDRKVDVEMGTVCTPYHRLILRVTAEIRENGSDSESDVIIIEDESQKSPVPEIIEVDEDDEELIPTGSSFDQTDNEIPGSMNMETESSKLYSSILEMSNVRMVCICGTRIRDTFFVVIQCKNCSNYQHAECYGIHKMSRIPKRHFCHDCACLLSDDLLQVRNPTTGEIISQRNDNHTDPRLIEYTISELKDIGRMRLILMYIYREKKSPQHFIRENFSRADYEKIMAKMVKLKVFKYEGKKLSLFLEKVNIYIRKHFRRSNSIHKCF